MKFLWKVAILAIALVSPVLADTRDSQKDKTSMERGASFAS